MAISPYSNCPCGSGKQFKWCCQPYYSYVEKALSRHERGQHAAAEQSVSQLVEKFPKVPQAWAYQAQVLFLQDKRAEADAALQKAFDLDPNFAYGFWLRGLMRLDEGEGQGALLLFRKTAELIDPSAKEVQAQVNSRIAELELQFNRPVAARAALERALHHAPQSKELREARESVFGPGSRLPEAARKEYAFRPSDMPEGLDTAATGKLTDALAAFEAITQSRPDNPAAWFNLGLVRAWLGDNRRAIEDLYRSIDLDDEARTEETAALAEILRCGHGLEREADYVEHRAYFEARDGEAVGKLLNDWAEARRLIVIGADREQAVLSAVLLAPATDLGVGITAPVARLQSYLLLKGPILRLWHSNREMLDQSVTELRQKVGAGVSDPHYETGPANFADVAGEVMLFPNREEADPLEIEKKMRDRAREFFEENWLRRSLKSLDGATPIDAAAHPTLRKRLPGIIRFMEQCLSGVTPRENGQPATPVYDFDRLRRKLGLPAAPLAEGAEQDIDSLSAAGLGALKAESLSDDRLGEAFRAALRLDAGDLAANFARHAIGRASIADRYPFFNHLIRSARDDGKPEEVLRLLTEGEQADAASNEGRRREEYSLERGRALARSGDVDGAYAVFKEAIDRSPSSLNLYAPAAESMLGRKQGARALEFAELGLKQARAQNNRDGEQQFMELVAAARKQG
jgi:tetratricopeptide (TPR) repeat protein